jgi:hypothetical protein
MAFCPKCRSEYRPEFTSCKSCGDVALVETLEAPETIELSPEDLPNTEPIGFTQGGSGRPIEVDGRVLDPARIFILANAVKLRDVLADQQIGALIFPLDDVLFPDNVPRFEVRVLKEQHERAEKLLVEMWRAADGIEHQEVDIETCPACGEKVPLSVEECPECGLVVGTGEERAGAEDA